MASSELSRVACVLMVVWVVIVQLADEVEAQRIANKTNYNDDLLGGAKAAALADHPLESQRWKRTAKAEAPFPYLVSVGLEKRARSSFRGDLGKRMLALPDSLSPEDDLHTPVSWLSGKRIKVSSRFRGDLGKRARSSFRGDLGKRQQLLAEAQDRQHEQEEHHEAPRNLYMDDNIHRLSPSLVSDRAHDQRYGGDDDSSDEIGREDDDGGNITFNAMVGTSERRWNHPAPRWRAN